MSKDARFTVASACFESARRVAVLPVGHRSRRLHGHSFRASVFAELPSGWGSFPGGEVDALHARLQERIAPLDYCYLNDVLDVPTDENLARWIGQKMDLPGIRRIAVQSTDMHGVDIDRTGTAHVWRRYRFQAAHRLPNVPLGHKCGRMHGHGFEVIIHAKQDLGSRNLSIDYDYLDEIWMPLQAELNYRCLNDVRGLENPTSEMVAAWIWRRLKDVLPELCWVTVYETASCGANFDGNNYRIWKDFTLDSAVVLRSAPTGDRRSGVHGHTFTLRLHLMAPLDASMGWTIDFGDVKQIFDPVLRALDHYPLLEIKGLQDCDTASIAAWIMAQAEVTIPGLVRVDLYESRGCGTVLGRAQNLPAMPI